MYPFAVSVPQEHQVLRDAEELAGLQEMQTSVLALSEALQEVLQSLQGGRRAFWNEAAQKLVILLSAPGASQGEHFLQVWGPYIQCSLVRP